MSRRAAAGFKVILLDEESGQFHFKVKGSRNPQSQYVATEPRAFQYPHTFVALTKLERRLSDILATVDVGFTHFLPRPPGN